MNNFKRYNILLLIYLVFIVKGFAQIQPQIIKEGSYEAVKIEKGQEIPGIIKINVTSLGNGIDIFYELKDGTQKSLNGMYHISLIGYNEHAIVEISHGIINGKAIRYWQKNISKIYEYKDGLLNGKAIWYYPDEKLRNMSVYNNGLIESMMSFHNNGQVEYERKFDKNGLTTGKVITYDKDRNIVSEEQFVDGLYHGTITTIDNKSKNVYTYKKGKIDGVFTAYYPNGNKQEQGIYTEGEKKEGKWNYWNENGNLIKEENYKTGVLDGTIKTLYPNGAKRSTQEYLFGKLNGLSVEYDEEPNTVISETMYVDNRRDGTSKFYNNGSLWRDCIYKDDKLISEKEYKNGKINIHRMIDDNGKLIDVLKYDNSGKAIYRNNVYKRPRSVKIVEDSSGIIDLQ